MYRNKSMLIHRHLSWKIVSTRGCPKYMYKNCLNTGMPEVHVQKLSQHGDARSTCTKIVSTRGCPKYMYKNAMHIHRYHTYPIHRYHTYVNTHIPHIHRKSSLYLPLGLVNLVLKVMGTPDEISSPPGWNRVSPGCPRNFNTELTEPTRQIKTTFLWTYPGTQIPHISHPQIPHICEYVYESCLTYVNMCTSHVSHMWVQGTHIPCKYAFTG